MIAGQRRNPALVGTLSALVAVFCFSSNDVLIKFLSGDYALHQVVLIRSLVGTLFLMLVFVPLDGGLRALRTRRLPMHMLRGGMVVMANMTFFLGIATLPLAEGVAIFFISPLLITLFSVIFLKETVGLWRWMAILVGLGGVLVVLRPGTAAFQWAAILPLIAAFGYAGLHMLTRHARDTESTVAMAFYVQVVFLAVSAAMGLVFGGGLLADQSDPSLAFLFRAWVWPTPFDFMIMVVLGLTSVTGGYFISLAYRTSEAALVAPVEYVAMPLAVIWGLIVFGEFPDTLALAGIALILGSGLVMIWREAVKRPIATDTPTRR